MMHRRRTAVAVGMVTGAILLAVATATFPVSAQTAGSGTEPKVTRVDVAPGLYEIAYSARQQAVYVTSTGSTTIPARLLKLDPVTLETRRAIPLPHRGFGLRLDDAADRLYVGHTTEGAVSVVNTVTDEVTATVQVIEKTRNANGQESTRHNLRELVVDRVNQRLFAPGLAVEDSALFVVDLRTLKLERMIPGLGFVTTGVAVDEDRGRLYVSNLEGKMFVFDTRSLALLQTWSIGIDQPLNLALDQTRGRLFVTDEGIESIDRMRAPRVPGFVSSGPGNRVGVVDAQTGRLLTSFPAGRQPIAPILDAERNRLFVTNRADGTVTAYDAMDHRLLHTVSLPDHPNSLALDGRGVVYVTVKARPGAEQGTLESVARIELP